MGDFTGNVIEDGVTTTAGVIPFKDADVSDTVTLTVDAPAGARGVLTTDVTHDGGEGVVSWSYSVDNADIQDLAAGQPLTQVYTLTLDDGNGGTSTQDVTITVTGTNDAPVAVADTANATEGGSTLSGSVATNDSDVDDGAV